MAIFDIILDNKCIAGVFYLFLRFAFAAYFESIFINFKISYGRRNYSIIYPGLIQEKSFPDIS